VPAHHHDVVAGQCGVVLAQGAELDVDRAGKVAGVELCGLSHVDHGGGIGCRWCGHAGAGERVPGGGPRGQCVGELSGEPFVADLACLPEHFLGVLVGVAQDH
jgi:hypothetical protein